MKITRYTPGKLKLKRECWARSEGGCSKELTREHVISKSVMRHIPKFGLRLGGADIAVPVTKKSGTITYLCKTHNGMLSPADKEACLLFSTIKDMFFSTILKVNEKPNGERVEENVKIEGNLIEKWLAKTFLNATTFEYFALQKSVDLDPFPLNLKNIAPFIFGERKFESPYGFYIRQSTEKQKNFHLRIEKIPIQFRSDTKFGNLYIPSYLKITYLGIDIIGNFNITDIPDETREKILKDNPSLFPSGVFYRPLKFTFGSKETKNEKFLNFIW